MMRFLLSAALCVATTAATAAPLVTFNFTNSSTGANGNYSSPTPFVTKNDIGVSASGGTYAFDAIIDTESRLVNKSNKGLGVNSLLSPGQIDGPLDLLTLTFDRQVYFVSALFTKVDSNDDFDLFVDGQLVASEVNIASENPADLGRLRGNQISFGADGVRFLGKGQEDDFRLGKITVEAVPLPPALLLFACALAGLGFAARRRTV